MKKLFVMLLAVCAVNLYAVNVYVGGVVMDGSDRTPAYWLNGTMHFLSLYEPLPDGTEYGAMAVENGTVYMCVAEKTRYGSYEAHVYRDGGEEIGEMLKTEYAGNICGMAVINGKAYLGISSNWCSNVYKNGKLVQENIGKQITSNNGVLYCSANKYRDDSYTTGYYGGGYTHRNNSSLNAYFHARQIRVINGNLYMMGSDGKGACVQTNDTRRDYIEGYGNICWDMAIVNGQYYYIMDHRLINQNGALVLSSSYEPLQIIGHGGYLYILYKNKQGALPEHFVGIYDPSANRITKYYKLPSCVGTKDFYVED